MNLAFLSASLVNAEVWQQILFVPFSVLSTVDALEQLLIKRKSTEIMS
jgi:hypothetical protein